MRLFFFTILYYTLVCVCLLIARCCTNFVRVECVRACIRSVYNLILTVENSLLRNMAAVASNPLRKPSLDLRALSCRVQQGYQYCNSAQLDKEDIIVYVYCIGFNSDTRRHGQCASGRRERRRSTEVCTNDNVGNFLFEGGSDVP
jgi:hypothetical protein